MDHRFASLSRLWRFDDDRASVRSFQDAQLRRLVAHAYERVPFYRSLFDRYHVHPSDIRGVDDLAVIPMTDKKDLQEAGPRARLAAGVDEADLFIRWTSGSTAQPIQIGCTWLEESLLSCLRARALGRLGLRPWKRTARLKIVSTSRKAPSWLMALRHAGIYRDVAIDCLLPSPELALHIAETDPHFLLGFPTIVSGVAELDRKPVFRHLKTIIVGGETSTPSTRRRIAEAFGVPVFDTYGSHEFNQIAVECPRSGLLHICGSIVLVEILNDSRPAMPGEEGEVVATALHSFAMPFIRYRLGDIAIKGPETCSCGRSASGTIQAVAGRKADYLLLTDGEKVHPFRVIRALSHGFEWIRRYQVIQESLDEIQIRLVAAHRPSAPEISKLSDVVETCLRHKAKVRFELTDHIPSGPQGKFRVCESRLHVDPQG